MHAVWPQAEELTGHLDHVRAQVSGQRAQSVGDHGIARETGKNRRIRVKAGGDDADTGIADHGGVVSGRAFRRMDQQHDRLDGLPCARRGREGGELALCASSGERTDGQHHARTLAPRPSLDGHLEKPREVRRTRTRTGRLDRGRRTTTELLHHPLEPRGAPHDATGRRARKLHRA